MDTLTVKIKDSNTLKLIRDLESLNLIQVVSDNTKRPSKKLSSIMAGSITEEEAKAMHDELKQM